MLISKSVLEEYLADKLDCCSDKFDELEETREFWFEDGCYGSCQCVSTSNFRINIANFSVETEMEEVICISGKGTASYDVIGYTWEGDEDAGGYIECANERGKETFKFMTCLNGNEFDDDITIIIL